MNYLRPSHPPSERVRDRFRPSSVVLAATLIAALACGSAAFAAAQSTAPSQQIAVTLEGTVRDSAGRPAGDASVVLLRSNRSKILETKTKADGTFLFSGLNAGVYIVRAEKPDAGIALTEAISLSGGEKRIDLVLKPGETAGAGTSGISSDGRTAPGSMEFADEPNFAVAGITDWNNVGLHASAMDPGSSEALAKETLALKSPAPDESSADASEEMLTGKRAIETEKKLQAALAEAPGSFEANHQLGEFYCHSKRYAEAIPLLATASQIDPSSLGNTYELALAYVGNGDLDRAREQSRKMISNANSADAHRLAGDIEERLGDPLGAVREYERATKLDASEQNYFEWGTELLVHRAAQPSAEVFTKGFSAHPDSARLLTALGAALFASGAYEQAARRLCEASDLKPADPAPYIFLGKMEKAAPEALPCSEEKLERFVAQQPENAFAHYYLGLSLWKRAKGSDNPGRLVRAKVHLEKAVEIDPKLAEAYLQLGIVQAESRDFAGSVSAYKKAIEVNPQIGEAHYRLGLAYKRIGDEVSARQEMQTYKQIEKTEADAREREQRELRQFLIILKDQPTGSAPH